MTVVCYYRYYSPIISHLSFNNIKIKYRSLKIHDFWIQYYALSRYFLVILMKEPYKTLPRTFHRFIHCTENESNRTLLVTKLHINVVTQCSLLCFLFTNRQFWRNTSVPSNNILDSRQRHDHNVVEKGNDES